MKLKYILIFLCLLIPLILLGEQICPRLDGCPITKEGVCVGCIELNVVETIVVKQSSKDPYDVSPSKCPNYFESHHGGKTCEIQRNLCDSNKYPTLCDKDFLGCKRVEKNYNKRFTRNHGKRNC